MFVHDFVQIDLPYGAARAEVLRDGARWMCPLGCAAYAEGAALQLRVGPSSNARVPSKMVSVHLERPQERQDSVAIPMDWVATGFVGLFPSMAAELDFAPLGTSITQVSLSGTYVAPLGLVGRTVDALLLHRVAEATVRAFLRQVTAALEMKIAEERVQAGVAAAGGARGPQGPAHVPLVLGTGRGALS